MIAATAAAVALAKGGDAFWICVPSALLVSAWSRTLKGVAIASAATVAAAALPVIAFGRRSRAVACAGDPDPCGERGDPAGRPRAG